MPTKERKALLLGSARLDSFVRLTGDNTPSTLWWVPPDALTQESSPDVRRGIVCALYARKKQQTKNYMHRVIFVIFVMVTLIVTIIASLRLLDIVNLNGTRPLFINPVIYTDPGKKIEKASFGDVVKKALEGTKGTYAVSIIDLQSGREYHRLEHRKFEAGSLYKLWIMATAFDQIIKKTFSKETVLSQDVAILNEKFNIDPEVAEQTEGEISLSVSDALFQMITYSDNYAALLLSERVKLSNVKSFLVKNEFKESSVGEPPMTTSSDIATFFKKIYEGSLVNNTASKEMLELLRKQRLNNKLPIYLPKGVVIAHKTGEIGEFTHDAGIVYTEKGNYIIVILSESTNPAGAEERIADVSKAVYEYFVR